MTSIERLAAEIGALRRQVNRTTPQLASSSIEDGAIREHDSAGDLVGQYGKQYDGTSAPAVFNGPLPPMPTTPVLEPVVKGVKVRWDGLFAGDAIVPMNFARVELHAGTDPALKADTADTLVSTFETPRGGEIVVSADPTPLYFRLVARNLAGKRSPATPVVSATPLAVTDGDITSVGVDKLTTGALAVGQRIVLGDEASSHAEATPDGFAVFRYNAEADTLYRSATLGDAGSPDMLQIAGSDGTVRASMSDTGTVVGQNLVVADRLHVAGIDFEERLRRAEQSRNVATFIMSPDNRSTASELGLFEFQFTAAYGHLYSFAVNGLAYGFTTTTATDYGTRYRYTSNGARPTIASPLLYARTEWHPAGNSGMKTADEVVSYHLPYFWAGGEAGDTKLFRVLISMWVNPATSSSINWPSLWSQVVSVTVLDHGQANALLWGVDNDGGGTGTPPPNPQLYYWEGAALWSRTWKGSGAKRLDTPNNYQGYYLALNGRQSSAWGFADLSGLLAGATVTRAETYVYAQHWNSYAGGVAGLGYHLAGTEPGGGPPAAYDTRQYNFARGEGKWVDLTFWRAAIQNGTLRGFTLNAPSDAGTYYGYASGAGQANGPVLRVWYTK